MAKQTIWVLGHHAVNAVLDINPERAVALWDAVNPNNSAQLKVLEKVEQLGLPIHPVDKRQLAKRCDSEQSQGVALQALPKADGTDKELGPFVAKLIENEKKQPLLLILDQVQDPA